MRFNAFAGFFLAPLPEAPDGRIGAPAPNRLASSFSRGSTLFAALLCIFCGCLDAIPDNTIKPPEAGSVTGKVIHACDETPIAGATVSIGGTQSAITDQLGEYRFTNVPAGSLTVQAAMAGFLVERQTVQVQETKPTVVNLQLVPEASTLPDTAALDVLFVVDNSGSMEQEQVALAAAFPKFMSALRAAWPKVDLRVGVISSDMGAGNFGLPSCEQPGGDAGRLQNKARSAGCPTPKNPWIEVNASSPASPTPEDQFSCIAKLGIQGCGFEQPLAAIVAALGPGKNPGFVRNDAALAIIVLTDEDDCSVTAKGVSLFDPSQQGLEDPLGPLTSFRCFEFGVSCDINDRNTIGARKQCVPSTSDGMMLDVDAHIQFLKGLKPPRSLFFAAIAGPASPVVVGKDGNNPALQPSCQVATSGLAVPGVRLKAVVDAFSPLSSFDSICSESYETTLQSLAQKIITTALLDGCSR
jgi:hypothetical protein